MYTLRQKATLYDIDFTKFRAFFFSFAVDCQFKMILGPGIDALAGGKDGRPY
jgi:hypothetical protein